MRAIEEYSAIGSGGAPLNERTPMQRREFIGCLGAATLGAICRPNLSYAQASGSVTHRTIQANGIHLHFVEQGEDP